jgi:hypothetical protein
MSTQNGILGVLTSQKLWTAPSKEQYLPAYFKEICDEYLLSEDKHRVYPVEVSGSYIHWRSIPVYGAGLYLINWNDLFNKAFITALMNLLNIQNDILMLSELVSFQ